ncbi:MAG: NAD(P)/FAD-dependent oxidoreductase, partial [Candidatus Omnitrophica bacterium]|nr:NAD(P)/FAD-dependent oxidoreductase [Candidatus Omnitrophota bacterium]
MRAYDVIIIGAGVIGTSVARELSRFKLDICVLEKEIEPAFGVSKSNSGIIHPGTQNPPGSLKGGLCVRGNFLIRKIARELGVDFKETGELIAAFNEEERLRLIDLKKAGERLGVPALQIVDRKWLRLHEPNLNEDAVAALYAPTAGIISPYRLVYDLYENAGRNGVEFRMANRVEGIVPQNGGFEIMTSRGVFRSRYCINAAGLFADEISGMAGITDFKIRPRKGEEFILDKKKENITNHLLFPLPSKTSKGVLVIKTADGNPMLGPTAEEVGDKEDLGTTDEGLKKVFGSARRLIPALNESDIIAYFAGLRPAAVAAQGRAQEDFIIREERQAPGFINLAGIQSPGLTAAPAIALMAAAILRKNGLLMKKKFRFHKYRKESVRLSAVSPAKGKRLIRSDPGYGDIVCRCEMVSAREIKDS